MQSPLKSPLKAQKRQRKPWTVDEMKALVQFIAMLSEMWDSMTAKSTWPHMRPGHS